MNESQPHPARGLNSVPLLLTVGLALALCTSCVAPIGADRVSTRRAYDQVDADALRTGKPSASTLSILHRYDLSRLAARRPDEAVRRLHELAVATNDRNLLFALAELCHIAGDDIRRSVKRPEPRDERDFYLGSAVYAYLFLFGDAPQPPPDAFDRRFRGACDLYNYSLGLALGGRKSTNAVIQLQSGRRRLPVGEIDISLGLIDPSLQLDTYNQILMADQLRVRGLTVRNREPGLGAPLVLVGHLHPELGIRRCAPATVFLRLPTSLAEVGSGKGSGALEVYSSYERPTVTIGQNKVPLELDLTAHSAYTLNQSFIWSLGMLQFLAPAERIKSQLILNEPYTPGQIPVVFVHGTFSSPVTWAELANSLNADPVLRQRYQVWSFIYSSGNPLIHSMSEFRDALTAMVRQLDPEGKDPALRQMVIVGHSQGGLLTKATAVETGDRIWREVSSERLEDLNISEEDRAELRHVLFLEPLPFVNRVVFICTPHHGSYLAGNFARNLARRLMRMPSAIVTRTTKLLPLTKGSSTDKFLRGRIPSSLDGMSPRNPGLLAMADIPIAPSIKAHSIIAVKGDGEPQHGRDGVVAYQSAHLGGVESEYIVRSHHSCLNSPATIEEVRRILHLHLRQLDPQ